MRSLLALLTLLVSATLPAADLQITIENITEARGLIRAGLFSDPKSFNKVDHDRSRGNNWEVVRTGKSTFVIKDIPPGVYAIALYHDVDGDDKLAQGRFGIPKEPWGHSLNPPIRLRAPRWEECAFALGDGDVYHMSIILRTLKTKDTKR